MPGPMSDWDADLLTAAALADSLESIGYDPMYHMREVHKRGHTQFWADALSAHNTKEGADTPKREDFDRIFSGFSGVCDLPAASLVTELLDAYPLAKVILSVRDVDAWVRSMNATIVHARVEPEQDTVGRAKLQQEMHALWGFEFDVNGVAFFHAHNKKVREEAARRGKEVFELDVSRPGEFERMCKWLGKKTPEGVRDFVRTDVWLSYKKEHGTGGYVKGV